MFKLARLKAGMTPRVREKAVAAGGAWLKGALLVVDANGNYAEAGADPASVAAVALSGVGTDTSGYNRLGQKGFPPGYCQGVSVEDEIAFRANYTGALPAANGGVYGVVSVNGDWMVDFTETTATVVKLVNRFTDSPLNVPEVEVVFLAAKVQVM